MSLPHLPFAEHARTYARTRMRHPFDPARARAHARPASLLLHCCVYEAGEGAGQVGFALVCTAPLNACLPRASRALDVLTIVFLCLVRCAPCYFECCSDLDRFVGQLFGGDIWAT